MDNLSRHASSNDPVPRRRLNTEPNTSYLGHCENSISRLRFGVLGTPAQNAQRRGYSSGGHYGRAGAHSFPVMSAYWLLFGINAAVFGTWHYSLMSNDRRLQNNILTNCLVSASAWDSGRYWTVITSAFTHFDLTHFAFNMFTLHTMCQIVAFVPGLHGLHILAIALGSAAAGSAGFLMQQKAKIPKTATMRNWSNAVRSSQYASALGASGAVMGVSAVATCLLPTMRVSFLFIPIGIPLWLVTIGYALFDGFSLDSPTSKTAHSGHLGGLAFGVAYYVAYLRKSPSGLWHVARRWVGRR